MWNITNLTVRKASLPERSVRVYSGNLPSPEVLFSSITKSKSLD